MKRYFIILIGFFITASALAQKNFQGEITYRLHASNDGKPDAALKIIFGVNKLKLRFKEKEDYNEEELLVLFDSAAMFTINKGTKTYTKKLLHINSPAKQIQKRSFAGYPSTPLTQETNGLGNILGGLMGTADIVFYLADSLYYNVPAAFTGNQELIPIQKNKIVLGAEIKMNMGYSGLTDTLLNNIITVEAVEIIPMLINEDEFSIPSDYVDSKSISYDVSTDTIAVASADTTLNAHPVKKTAPKKPIKSTKPKTPVKSSTVKRKE